MAAPTSVSTSQQRPVITHPLPHRPYNPFLKTIWNHEGLQVSPCTEGTAKLWKSNRSIDQRSVHLPEQPEAARVLGAGPMTSSPERISYTTTPQPPALPFLTKWQLKARVRSMPELHASRRTTRRPSETIKEYIYVLVDGNRLVPHPHLVKQGTAGGHSAARRLHSRLQAHLNVKASALGNGLEIITHIYYDKVRLLRTYGFENRESHQKFVDFCHGFKMYHHYTVFANIGAGQAYQLSENLLWACSDPRCRQIVFGKPTFDAYLGVITDFAMEHPLEDFWDKIDPLCEAKDVFSRDMSEPLREIPTPQSKHNLPQPPGQTPQPRSYSEWRQRVGSSSTPMELDGTAEARPSSCRETCGSILRNRWGHRIDPPMTYSKKVRDRLAARKPRICNVHHLRGPCPYGVGCEYNHDPLSEDEISALRILAREQPCREGNECEVVDCFAGHHCPRGHRCHTECRFGARKHLNGKEMHIRDTRILNAALDSLKRTPSFINSTAEEQSDKGKQRADRWTA